MAPQTCLVSNLMHFRPSYSFLRPLCIRYFSFEALRLVDASGGGNADTIFTDEQLDEMCNACREPGAPPPLGCPGGPTNSRLAASTGEVGALFRAYT